MLFLTIVPFYPNFLSRIKKGIMRLPNQQVDSIKKEVKRKIWPALSVVFLYLYINLYFTILVALKPNFNIVFFIIIVNSAVMASYFFLELLDIREKIWEKFLVKWKSLPTIIHILICGICFFWIFFLLFKAFPAMKKSYEAK
jgi:hypothetical protein